MPPKKSKKSKNQDWDDDSGEINNYLFVTKILNNLFYMIISVCTILIFVFHNLQMKKPRKQKKTSVLKM